ncbi:MAG: Shikimate dehydrogenase (NADP(+)) [Gemmatimonadaceae bacterium]|nr:Shikimate dehydrogenase (NADP(+)) [Gemmatimonadaceae bacterium]
MNRPPGRLVLLGRPVAHSLSPRFQNAALLKAGIPLTYEAIDVAPLKLADTMSALRLVRGAGNVTIPHKTAVADLCDCLTPVATRTGAVNTFWHDAAGTLNGDNTDVEGFLRLVESLRLPSLPQRVAILGAGGAAAAVCDAVASWPGTTALLWSRHPETAARLAKRYAACVSPVTDIEDCVRSAGLVVNATPVGLLDEDIPLPVHLIPRDAAVTDLVYRTTETRWVREARAHGHPAADGLVMLIEQGAAAFRRWFGVEPDRDAMRRAAGR